MNFEAWLEETAQEIIFGQVQTLFEWTSGCDSLNSTTHREVPMCQRDTFWELGI